MYEKLTMAVMLICNFIIATQWAKYGIMQVSIQRPLNTRALGAGFVGMLTFTAAGLAQKYGHVEFAYLTEEHLWRTAGILLAPPFIWLMFFRYTLMPAGQYDYNQAIIRTTFWALQNYRPGVRLVDQGNTLKQFPIAQRTLQLFESAIAAQSKGSNVSTIPKVIDLDEMEVSYRHTISTSCPNCGMPVEISVQAMAGAEGHCVYCSKMLTVKRIGSKLYINCYGSSRRTVTPHHRKNIAIAYEEMGLLLRMMNRFADAQEAYEMARGVTNGLLEDEPNNQEYLSLLSLIAFRQAEAYHAQGSHALAREHYNEALAIDRKTGQSQDRQLIGNLLAQLK
ncbi:MAG: tetratricopeptide repeat protein [Patescibacteria group bacterium]